MYVVMINMVEIYCSWYDIHLPRRIDNLQSNGQTLGRERERERETKTKYTKYHLSPSLPHTHSHTHLHKSHNTVYQILQVLVSHGAWKEGGNRMPPALGSHPYHADQRHHRCHKRGVEGGAPGPYPHHQHN